MLHRITVIVSHVIGGPVLMLVEISFFPLRILSSFQGKFQFLISL